MFTRRYFRHSLPLTFIAFLLLCGLVTAEIPELISLTDNPSNDFMIRKASGRERATLLSLAIPKFFLLDTHKSGCEARACRLFSLNLNGTIPSDSPELQSVLRR